jgi:hypothetical protein
MNGPSATPAPQARPGFLDVHGNRGIDIIFEDEARAQERATGETGPQH